MALDVKIGKQEDSYIIKYLFIPKGLSDKSEENKPKELYFKKDSERGLDLLLSQLKNLYGNLIIEFLNKEGIGELTHEEKSRIIGKYSRQDYHYSYFPEQRNLIKQVKKGI